jgi:hypothetical protein
MVSIPRFVYYLHHRYNLHWRLIVKHVTQTLVMAPALSLHYRRRSRRETMYNPPRRRLLRSQ